MLDAYTYVFVCIKNTYYYILMITSEETKGKMKECFEPIEIIEYITCQHLLVA